MTHMNSNISHTETEPLENRLKDLEKARCMDTYAKKLLEHKQYFIASMLSRIDNGHSTSDDNEHSLSYAEVKALAMEDPQIKEHAENAGELHTDKTPAPTDDIAASLREEVKAAAKRAEERIRTLNTQLEHLHEELALMEEKLKKRADAMRRLAEGGADGTGHNEGDEN